MKIPLDRQAKTPIYLQIRDRISHLIQTGHLATDTQLPSIRTLARTVNVNKLTVLEAYSVLEADGLVRVKKGAGYFINPINTSHLTNHPFDAARAKTGKFLDQSTDSFTGQDTQRLLSHPQSALGALHKGSFNPAQTVIIPTQGISAFSDIYAASLHSHTLEDYVDFGLGFPQPTGLDDLTRIARRAMKEAHTFFHPGDPQGDLELRGQISQLLIQQGLEISPNHLLVTSGSMQSLSLLSAHFVSPSDWVIVEAPTYHGFLSILQQRGAQIIGIPMTPHGMNLDLLSRYLQSHRPRLIYTMSSLQNPTGITTSANHRRQLLSLAEEYDCLIVEDNAYEPLSFSTTPPPIKAFDTHHRVIYVGTFSKTLMPGLRVGYTAITGSQRQALIERKLLHDFHISTASQVILKEYLSSGHYRRHLSKLRTLHRDRRDHMIEMLVRYFPTEVTWTVPNGGTFLWIQLPDALSLSNVCNAAIAQKVLVGSGAAFFPTQQGYPAMRLNFSLPPDKTKRGIKVLGDILKQAMMATT
ncbi:MAG: PLP-dependent aminotransferase family protein [Cyanobacteria bacterium P01_D01_bin.105]